jgi:hypothetical protein
MVQVVVVGETAVALMTGTVLQLFGFAGILFVATNNWEKNSRNLLPAGEQQTRQFTEFPGTEMTKLAAMKVANRLIEMSKKVEPLGCNVNENLAPVGMPAAAADEAALFEAVEEAGNVRLAGDHSRGNFAAEEAIGSAAKNAEHVVLIRGQVVFFQELGRAAGEQVGGSGELDKNGLLVTLAGVGGTGSGSGHCIKDGCWNEQVSKSSN